jgi:hypothetical protein
MKYMLLTYLDEKAWMGLGTADRSASWRNALRT